MLLGCSEKDSIGDSSFEKVDNLSRLIAEGLENKDGFYFTFENKFSKNINGVLFVLPKSSCFNCFEYLTDELALFYSEYNLNKIIVIKNENIKNREIRFSLRNVINADSIDVFNNLDFDIVNPHEFYPKLGLIKNGTLSCVEVFEQGDDLKVRNYFKFLKVMIE
ncbi:hypothetical protein SAMN04487988_10582 [Algoriphagus hitonicola]|uniref:AhpC/TSA family protein n=2 Tax=Algoriphagus hitonicola TaxID=435880 RepID=A0A1I2SUQ2_9BACT|nr:hypothetical protein SAMN04487988_10582 [Algoriphagus hitonicola]